MLQLMIKNKGALSILTLFILIPIMLFSGILIDFARVKATQAQAASAAEMYANSYLSVYDELLNEVYGLFAVTQSEDGMEAVNNLRDYMQATYTPNSADKTHLTNANALGVQDALKRLINGGQKDYSNALQLTGNSFSSWETETLKPLVNGSNYDALQMQISEYVKFIGPTELLANTEIANMLKPDSEGNVNADKTKNEIEQTNKNYQRIKRKNEIDQKIGILNTQLNELYKAMSGYDSAFSDYYDADSGVSAYVSKEDTTYGDAANRINEAFEEFKSVYGSIKNDGDASSYRGRLKKILRLHPNWGYLKNLEDIGECFSGTPAAAANLSDGKMINYDKYRDYLYKCYIDPNDHSAPIQNSYANVAEARETLVARAGSFSQNLNSIKNDINDLIGEIEAELPTITDEDEKASTQKFIDGLKKDYSPILELDKDGSPDKRKMWVVANFDYNNFSSDFDEYARASENKIIEDLKNTFEDSHNGLSAYDDELKKAYDDISGYIDKLTDSDVNLDSVTGQIDTWIGKWEDLYIPPSNSNIMKNNFDKYYTKFDKNTTTDSGGITYKELYETLKSWNSLPDGQTEDNNEEKKAKKLVSDLWDVMDKAEFNNIKLRESLANKIMPSGEDKGEDNSKKTELKDIFDKDDSGLAPPDAGTVFINKLLLMLYNYGMFTCQTSDKRIDKDNNDKVIDDQPFSYQGIALAEKDGSGKYEASETNFLLYGELEYLFNGDKNPEKNFNAVRNDLAVIRFVPNYISTFTIEEINSIIEGIKAALLYTPAAIAVAEMLRMAIAAFETWCDLDLLYGGHSVLLYKNSFGDLSFIAKLKTIENGQGLFDQLDSYSGGSLSSGNSSPSPSNIKVNYRQYLIILQMIFVSQDQMIKRTSDLIEVNMNYMKNGESDADDEKKTVECSYNLSEAYTGVKVSCTVKKDFIFIGGVFDAKGSGYDEAAALSDSASGKTYTYTVVREY